MRLLYVTHMRLPTEKAYGIQMMQTCAALSDEGVMVDVVTAKRKNTIAKDIFSYYQLSDKLFRFQSLSIPEWWHESRHGFWLHMMLFSFATIWNTCHEKYDVVYSREPFPLLFFSWLGYRTVYEMHDFPMQYQWFHRWFCRQIDSIVVTNTWAYEQLQRRYDVAAGKLVMTPNGYNEDLFNKKNCSI